MAGYSKSSIKIDNLLNIIKSLHDIGANVRLNCNCIAGYIDSANKIQDYIRWAKEVGADKIRFAELKLKDDSFVDLAKVLNYKYGLNDNPFLEGCNNDVVIFGIPVNFRQMCGLQTSKRIKPKNPKQYIKQVLYYNGKFYEGWQTVVKEATMEGKEIEDEEITEILYQVKDGRLKVREALTKLKNGEKGKAIKEVIKHKSSGGCSY
jgi:hypothetical protein